MLPAMIQLALPLWPWVLVGPLSFVLLLVVSEVGMLVRLRRAPGVQAPSLARTPFGGIKHLSRASWMHRHNRLPEYFASCFDHLGPSDIRCVELNAFGKRVLFTEEPEHVKALLSSKFSTFGKGKILQKLMRRFLGATSVFASDGKVWHRSRGLIRPMFVKERMHDVSLLDRWSQLFLTKLPASGQTVDICDLFYRLSMDVTTDFLLGKGADSLTNPCDEFSVAFDAVQHAQLDMLLIGIKVLEAFIEPFINETLALTSDDLEKLSKSDKGFNFLHSIALATRDRTVIRDQIISILLAGRDTTAATMSWALFELANHPEVWQKLRKLVLEKFGPSRQPSYREIKDFTYMTHCLYETLRLYPVLAVNRRSGLCNTTLPGKPGQPDITVLEGDSVIYSVWSLQRRKDLYPPVSETFADPDLWSPERWDHWQPKPWQFFPFNGGPRICMGQDFAMTEMAFVIIRLLQKYERAEYRGDPAAQFYQANLVGRPGQGVPVALFEAESP